LKARFKREVGIPPAEYVIRCKIAVARTRLAQSDATITRVAMDLGFPSSQFFATVFRRFTGRKPSALRQSAAEPRRIGSS
jgi:AraC-like DNA-binding protein